MNTVGHSTPDIEPERGFLVVDPWRIEYHRYAASNAGLPVLVLLHEGLGCVSMWRDFPARLAAHTGAEVFVYSRPGYGASSPVALPRPTTYMHHEGQVVLPAVLDAAGIGPCVLIGHSDGGSIAILHAGGTPGRRVRGLVLIAAHVFNEPVTVASIRTAQDQYRDTDLREKLARHHGDNVDIAFRGWNDVWLSDAFRRWNIEPSLANIHVPVLVVQGEDDAYGTRAQVDAIARGLKGPVDILLWPDCGHAPHREAPDRLLAGIGDFLRERI